MNSSDLALFEDIWSALDAAGSDRSVEERTEERGARASRLPPPRVELSGTAGLPSVYQVGALATATVAAATAAVAAVHSARSGASPVVHVDRGHATAGFKCERLLEAQGWTLPPVWDPIAGDYRAQDGFIRLHTNYRHHRDAVLRVLGTAESREAVASAVSTWRAEDLESAVVAERGCAARLRTTAEWAAHPQGVAVSREPLFTVTTRSAGASLAATGLLGREGSAYARDRRGAPLAGVRVLDLTRVMAGPVCTRLLAAYGAEVLRIDPPGFEEGGALLPEMTAGKRRAFVDLRDASGRAAFERLLAGAHVMVHGYRADALDRLGYGAARRREINPDLIDVSHDAYGWSGPWAHRRGFDSLVQMSVGIADAGRAAARSDGPVPLPAQALDHGCGYLLAAAACRALVRLLVDGRASEVRLSLARTAKLLVDLGDSGDIAAPDLPAAAIDRWCETAATAWGPVRRVRCPGWIDGVDPRWTIAAGPLGADAAEWS
ncbi:MAG TPA: CoA transferase [Polyangiaceae bacterium]|nr:CoA transferase [Polyangiaceae bacterium]